MIHPTAPVAPALFAFAETERRDGAALLRAFILGGEIECRFGNAVSPYHYARGWHITSTCGVFGAAVGVGALLGLSEEQFGWALGNASAQAAGLVETLGTMSKSISVGNAARNGMTSALLAAEDFSGPAKPLEGPARLPAGLRGRAAARGTDRRARRDLGDRQEHLQALSGRRGAESGHGGLPRPAPQGRRARSRTWRRSS